MNLGNLLHQFVSDTQFQTVAALIVLDLILGVAAAAKTRTFQVAYLANFARNDVLGKVVPFFVIDSAAIVAGGTNIFIPGVDLTNVAHGMFVLVTAAMVGSLLSSLKDLGFSTIPAAAGSGR
jgi:hypothetical protein